MKLANEDVRRVKSLLSSDDFASIAEISRPTETIIGILRDAFQENVLSRIMRYLFDSSESHVLRDDFLRTWLKALPPIRYTLGRGRKEIKAHFNWHLTNDASTSRYLDLLLVISRNKQSAPTAVIGIETKLDAPESDRQIEDYQRAIVRQFPRAQRRVLLFLTPDGRSNRTGKRNSACPCFNVSYEAIAGTCATIATNLQATTEARRTRTLLDDLSQFVSRDLMKDKRRSEIDRLVKGIEANPDLSPALDILRGVGHRPTIRTFVYELLLPAIRKDVGDVEVEWHYPQSSARPNEFNFRHQAIEDKLPINAKFELYYMLHSPKREPTTGDSFAISLMARKVGANFSKAAIAQLNLIIGELPKSEGHVRQWGPWKCLWTSAEYRLGSLTRDEAAKLSEIFSRSVKKTLPRLLKRL